MLSFGWQADWDQDPGDLAILAHAAEHQQSVVTLDKDFGELAIVRAIPHRGILRLVDIRGADHGAVAIAAINAHGTALAKGAIVTVEPGRVRVRPPESDAD